MSFAGMVVAMQSEARGLHAAAGRFSRREPSTRTARINFCGMGWTRASRAAQELVRAGATALVSWGTAGALDARLSTGTIVVATEVISPSSADDFTRAHTTPRWRTRLADALMSNAEVVQGPIFTSPRALITAVEKSAAFERTHALAVDMESAAIEEVARAHALPFVAVRAIIDTAEDTLPPPLARSLLASADAPLRPWQVALPLIAAPTHWIALAQLARKHRRACNALRNCAPLALASAESAAWERDA